MLDSPFDWEGAMIAKQQEKWMEACEIATSEQDPKKLMALIAEITRLLQVKRYQRSESSNPDCLKHP
jgi:hypothetical protein